MMAVRGLTEKSSDADSLPELIGFAAERQMELEVGGLLGMLFCRLFLEGLSALHEAGALAFFGTLAPRADAKVLGRRWNVRFRAKGLGPLPNPSRSCRTVYEWPHMRSAQGEPGGQVGSQSERPLFDREPMSAHGAMLTLSLHVSNRLLPPCSSIGTGGEHRVSVTSNYAKPGLHEVVVPMDTQFGTPEPEDVTVDDGVIWRGPVRTLMASGFFPTPQQINITNLRLVPLYPAT